MFFFYTAACLAA